MKIGKPFKGSEFEVQLPQTKEKKAEDEAAKDSKNRTCASILRLKKS